jgi:NTE family protein
MARRTRPLGVALQGGGAHGAFTWGVLDRILEDGRFDIQAITGTSAGSFNGVALAYGLLTGGPESARELLATVWTEIGKRGTPGAFVTGRSNDPSFSLLAKMGQRMTSSLSPSMINPLGLDPIRDVISTHIDFEQLRTRKGKLELGIAATNAQTGRMRLFTRDELTVEMILASACLPKVTPAVEIDGASYWDGGYSSNPPLLPLVQSGPDDTLMVLIVPTEFDGVPGSASEIEGRETEFIFVSGFLRETDLLAQATRRAHASRWPFVGQLEKNLRRMRWHEIDGGQVTSELDPDSRGLAYTPFLESLRDAGREHAETWLAEKAQSVGHTSTVNLATLAPWGA